MWGRGLRLSAGQRPASVPIPYSTFSATHRETAVTHFLGANLTNSTTSQFCRPEITTVFPAISPRYPSLATVSTFHRPDFLEQPRVLHPRAPLETGVRSSRDKTAHHHPRPPTSFASASKNDST